MIYVIRNRICAAVRCKYADTDKAQVLHGAVVMVFGARTEGRASGKKYVY